MCGLFGTFGRGVIAADVKAFEEGLRTIYLRGPHSTGMGWWDTQKPGNDYVKHSLDPHSFLDHKDVKSRIFKIQDPLVIMGHVRFATRGKINPDNAHPFQCKNILLAHNGSLNHITGMQDYHKFEVDSEALTSFLANNGIDKLLKNIRGAYALTYIDSKTKTFNLVRNWERDLFLTKRKNVATWFYGSERDHLTWILNRNKIEHEEIKLLPIETLFTYDFKEATMSERKIETWEPYNSDAFGWSHYRQPSDYGHHGSGNYNMRSFIGPHGNGTDYLKRYGLKINDWIKVKLDNYEPYNIHSTGGKVEGSFEDAKSPDATIRGWNFDPEKMGGKLFIPGWYCAQVSGARWDGDDQEYVINISEYSPVGDMPNIKEPVLAVPDKTDPINFKTYLPKNEPDGLNRKLFEKLTVKGCSICKKNLYWNKSELVTWVTVDNKHEPLCDSCTDCLEELGCDEERAGNLIRTGEPLKSPIQH